MKAAISPGSIAVFLCALTLPWRSYLPAATIESAPVEVRLSTGETFAVPPGWHLEKGGGRAPGKFGTVLTVLRTRGEPSSSAPVFTAVLIPGLRLPSVDVDEALSALAFLEDGIEVDEPGKAEFAADKKSFTRLWKCRGAEDTPLMIETAVRETPDGILRVNLRYPEELPPDEYAAVRELRKIVRFPEAAEPIFAQDLPARSSSLSKRQVRPRPRTMEEFVQQNRRAIVMASNDSGGGSAFVCNLNGKSLLITNIHVAASTARLIFRNVDREMLSPGTAYAAVNRDIIVYELGNAGEDGLEFHDTMHSVAVGDEIFILGNPDAAGVLRPIPGKIVGIGPDLVEVDAPFVPGNSGSPIVHNRSGKVVGIASFLTVQPNEFGPDGTMHQTIRRFGYRIDGVPAWQAVDWKTFYADRVNAWAVEKLTNDLTQLVDDLANDGFLEVERHQHPALRPYVQSWTREQQRGMSRADRRRLNASLIGYIKSVSQRDIAKVLPGMTYDFFIQQVQQSAQSRSALERSLDRMSKNLD